MLIFAFLNQGILNSAHRAVGCIPAMECTMGMQRQRLSLFRLPCRRPTTPQLARSNSYDAFALAEPAAKAVEVERAIFQTVACEVVQSRGTAPYGADAHASCFLSCYFGTEWKIDHQLTALTI